MNILLLGGNGFLGSHISDWLIKNNHYVRIIDKSAEKYRKPLKDIDYRYIDINYIPGVIEALDGIDMVFHLACSTVPSTSNVDILNDINQNLYSSIRFLDIFVKSGLKNIIFFSTGGAIYGQPVTIPIPETHPTEPVSSYGIVKLTLEKYLSVYENNFGINPLIIRPSNPYGPRQGHQAVQGVISTFLYKIKRNEELVIWGDGDSIRDYIYIDDFTNLTCQLAIKQERGIFNIGSSVGFSINQILEIVKKVTGEKVIVKYLPQRNSDISKVILGTTKLSSVISPYDLIPLDEGVQRYWEWINHSHGDSI